MNLKNLSVTTKIPKLLEDKLNNKKVDQIYKRFEKSIDLKKNFIVAVSGGPDSLALAFLAKIFSIKNNLVSKFYIVDHKLRPESTKEAKTVKKILSKYLIHAEILTWRGKKPLKNIQSLARNKRLELLFKKADEMKINDILLGHHQDDLFENFFIRMLRGSGLKGLVSLDKKSTVKDKNLIRPLIDEKKENLVFISKHVYNFYVMDPYNEDEKYKRILIRNLIQKLKDKGLDEKKFKTTIKNLKISNITIEFYVNENLRKNSFYSSKHQRLILNEDFFNQAQEVIFRSFSDSLKLIGNKHYATRGKKLSKVIGLIKKKQTFKVTLGNCIVERVNQTVIISKEA